MKLKSLVASLCLTPLLLSNAFAQKTTEPEEKQVYLYEAAQSDLNLASSYKQLIAPVLDKAEWLASYGTASPAQIEEVDGVQYWVFSGCQPHNCPAQSYVAMYEPKQKKMVAGALITNEYAELDMKRSEIHWLGNAELEFARILAKYFY